MIFENGQIRFRPFGPLIAFRNVVLSHRGEFLRSRIRSVLPLALALCASLIDQDLLFLILKLCSWGAMTGIFIAALPKSHVNTILKPLDYEGNICGSTEGFGNLPYLIYTDTAGNGVCSASCYSGTPVDYTDASSWTFSDLTCRYNTPSTSSPVALVASSTCLPNYDSYALLYRCIPKDYTSLSQAFFAATGTSVDVEQLSSHKNSIEKFVSDVYYSSPILFGCGLGVSSELIFIEVSPSSAAELASTWLIYLYR